MINIDTACRGFLFFSNLSWVIPLLILGFFLINKKFFYHAAVLCAFSILLNVALKVTFKVPLAEFLHKPGYAFPSGHMQLSSVLYLWLGYHFRHRTFHILLAVLLTGISFGLVHFGYHTLVEVVAGFFVASLLVAGYLQLLKHWQGSAPLLLLTIAPMLLIYIKAQYMLLTFHWVSFFALAVLTLSGRLTYANSM